jgi:hypothetical protein
MGEPKRGSNRAKESSSKCLFVCLFVSSQVTRQHLNVYGSQESNYYYQLDRFVKDLQVLTDKNAPHR